MVTRGGRKEKLQKRCNSSIAFRPKATIFVIGRSSDLFRIYRLPIHLLADSGKSDKFFFGTYSYGDSS